MENMENLENMEGLTRDQQEVLNVTKNITDARSLIDFIKQERNALFQLNHILTKNIMTIQMQKAYGVFLMGMGYTVTQDEMEYYDYDLQFVIEEKEFTYVFLDLYKKVMKLAKSNNWEELKVLTQYMLLHFRNNHNYVETQRKSISYALDGLHFRNSSYQDTREESINHISEEIEKLSHKNSRNK